MSLIRGVDVSHNNGVVNFRDLYQQGVRFVFIKATEGDSFADPALASNWHNALAAGLRVGAYHFHRPGTRAADQAEHFITTMNAKVKPWVAGTPGVLMPMLDCETDDGHSPATVAASALTWLGEVHQAAKRTPGVYVSPGFLGSRMARDKRLNSYYLWLAQWTTSKTVPRPPAPFSKVTFWQWDGTGMDDDYFVGSQSELDAQASIHPKPAPTPPEDDVTDADIEKIAQRVAALVWRADTMPAPAESPSFETNKTWTHDSGLSGALNLLYRIAKKVGA